MGRAPGDEGKYASELLLAKDGADLDMHQRPTQCVHQADPEHVQGEQGVVHMFSSYMVHENMVDHRANGGAEAGQVVDHTDPDTVHLHPGDTKRQQHQEEEKRDA